MGQCTNCGGLIEGKYVHVVQSAKTVCWVCGPCQLNVKTLKLILTRNDVDDTWGLVNVVPLEMLKNEGST